jgi:hypothetical protein
MGGLWSWDDSIQAGGTPSKQELRLLEKVSASSVLRVVVYWQEGSFLSAAEFARCIH